MVSLTSSSPKTSVDVTVELVSDDAFVYCAAYETSSHGTPTINDVMYQSQATLTNNSIATVTIDSLIPHTNYSIYCLAMSSYGTTSSESSMLGTVTTIVTDCCKSIFVDLFDNTFLEDHIALNTIQLSIDAAPSAELIIDFVTSPSSSAVYPSSLAISSKSLQSIYELTIVAGAADVYSLALTLSGSSSNEYSVVYGSKGSNFTVLTTTQEPTTPVLLSAVLSDDGSYITLSFDSATDKSGYSYAFPCDNLLSFADNTLSKCVWSDDASKIMIYSSSSALTVNSSISILGSKLKAKCYSDANTCSAWQFIPSDTVFVESPSVSSTPLVSIGAPSTINGCNSLSIDLSSSSGHGGRAWVSVAFSVESKGSNVDALESYLNANYSMLTEVPSSYFNGGSLYGITVTLCNFLGACGSSTHRLTVLNTNDLVPFVQIAGQSLVTVTHTDEYLDLVAYAYTESCSGVRSASNLDYSWVVTNYASLTSEAKDSSKFRVRTSELDAGNTYVIKVTVLQTVTGKSSSATVKVYVLPSALVASVTDGTEQSLRVGNSLTLNAGSSYDPDVDGYFGINAGLYFAWSCVQISPTYMSTCSVTLEVLAFNESIVLNASESDLDTVLLITLEVYNDDRRTDLSIKVNVIDSESPLVAITTSPNSLVNVNIKESTVIAGTVESYSKCTMTWSSDDSSLDLASAALTPFESSIFSEFPQPVYLVLDTGSLQERSKYIFTLKCGSSSSSIEVSTNSAPLPGYFDIAPSTGTELSTTFTLSASLWCDEDLPLRYIFGFYANNGSDVDVLLSIRGLSEIGSVLSILPAGAAADNTLEVGVKVYDAHGSYSTATNYVQVLENAGDIEDLIETALNDLGSSDQVKQVLAVASTVLSRYNCSSNCTATTRLYNSFLSALNDLVLNEDASSITVGDWANSISAIVTNADYFNSTDIIFDIIYSILDAAYSESIDYSLTSRVLDTLDISSKVSGNDTSVIAELAGLYGEVVSSQLYAGEDAVSHILDAFRVVSVTLSPVADTIGVYTPLTQEEIDGNSFSSYISMDTTSGATNEVRVVGVTINPGFMHNFTSDALRLYVSGIDSLKPASSDLTTINSTYVTIVLQNSNPIDLTEIPSDFVFTTSCIRDGASSEFYTCPDSGYNITHTCTNEIYDYNITSACPGKHASTLCSKIDLNNFSVDETSCTLLSYSAFNTSCSCLLSSAATNSSRRLSGDSSGVMTIASVSAKAFASYGGEEFERTSKIIVVPEQDKTIIISMFTVLWALCMLIGALFALRHFFGRKSSTEKMIDMTSKESIKTYLDEYISTAVPSVFSNKPFFTRLFNELGNNHRYWNIFFSKGRISNIRKMCLCFKILFIQAFIMFLLSILYNYECPEDDDSCSQFTVQSKCLDKKAPFDEGRSYCNWDSEYNTCYYKEPSFSISVIIAIFIITSLLIALVMVPIDKLFEVLESPIQGSLKNDDIDDDRSDTDAITRINTVVIPKHTAVAYQVAKTGMDIINFNAATYQYHLKLNKESSIEILRADDNEYIDFSSSLVEKSTSAPTSPSRLKKNNSVAPSISAMDNSLFLFQELAEDIHWQQQVLTHEEVVDFNYQWGIVKRTSSEAAGHHLLHMDMLRSGAKIMNELIYVRQEVMRQTKALREVEDEHAQGLIILNLFVLDILGRDTKSAKIFQSKHDEEFTKLRGVTLAFKIVAVLTTIILGVFFLYYAIYNSYKRENQWQRAFLTAYLIQFVTEMLLIETIECMWAHFFVPDIIGKEVKRALTLLFEATEKLSSSVIPDEHFILNAPSYLFLSTNVAKEFPNLLESMIVSSYHSHLPGELAKKWELKVHRKREKTIARRMWHSFMKFMAASNVMVRKASFRVLQPCILGVVAILCGKVFNNVAGTIIFIIGIVIINLIGLRWKYLSDEHTVMNIAKKQVSPITESVPKMTGEAKNQVATVANGIEDASKESRNQVNSRAGMIRAAINRLCPINFDSGSVRNRLGQIRFDFRMFTLNKSKSKQSQQTREKRNDNDDADSEYSEYSEYTESVGGSGRYDAETQEEHRPAANV